MPDFAATAVAQPSQISIKKSINPSAFYRYNELEALGFGKYLKFRRAIKRGDLKAHFCGRTVLIKGADLLIFIGATQ